MGRDWVCHLGLRIRWMPNYILTFKVMSSSNPWSGLVLMWRKCTFNRIMIPTPNWPRNGLKTKDSRFLYGLLNHQTAIQLNTCGITLREGLMSMKFLQKTFISNGIEWRRSGKLYPKMWCRIWLLVCLGGVLQWWRPRVDILNINFYCFWYLKQTATKSFKCAAILYLLLSAQSP